MKHCVLAAVMACVGCLVVAHPLFAQSSASLPRPWGRVSFFSNIAQTGVDAGPSRGFGEFTSSLTYQMPDRDDDGFEYGIDLRHSGFDAIGRSQRLSIYDGFVGGRMGDGTIKARIGHMWLTDLGALGSVAGGLVEVRQRARAASKLGRLRVGAFGGFEPAIYEGGYAPNVRKMGGYVAADGEGARRHVVGLVMVRNQSVSERTVLTTTNFVPVGRKFFLYHAAEYDVRQPAGEGRRGLAYLFTNVRVSPTDRIELQGTYNRGRSVDTRSLTEDVLAGRPLTRLGIDGLLYESRGGRVTVAVARRAHVYAGYSRDKTNRDDAPTNRTTFGGNVSNVFGFDFSASDSVLVGSGRRYQSWYMSGGRQVGRALYLSGDYSKSLSLIHFTRSDDVLIELRPETTRVSGNSVLYVGRRISLLITVERTLDDQTREFRMLSGITYRF